MIGETRIDTSRIDPNTGNRGKKPKNAVFIDEPRQASTLIKTAFFLTKQVFGSP